MADEAFLEVRSTLSIKAPKHHLLALNYTSLFQLPKQSCLVVPVQVCSIELIHFRAVNIIPILLKLSIDQILSCWTCNDALVKLVHVYLFHDLWPSLIVNRYPAQVALQTEHKGIVATVTQQDEGECQGCKLHESIPLDHCHLVADCPQESYDTQNDHEHSYTIA